MTTAKGLQRWVTWLPLVVVTLPTVCLLWFMGQAVRNERLAVKQKLVDLYREQLADTRSKTERRWASVIERIGKDLPPSPGPIFKALMSCPQDVNDPSHPLCVQAAIVYDPSGQALYPLLDQAGLSRGLGLDRSEFFHEAWEAEYVQGDPSEAATSYQQLALRSPDPNVRVAATMGAVRCLVKIGQVTQAVAVADRLLAESRVPRSPALATSLLNLRIQVLQILRTTQPARYLQRASDLLQEALDYQTVSLFSQTRAFVLAKAVELLPEDQAGGPMQAEVRTAGILHDAEVLSLQVVEEVSSVDGWVDRVHGSGQTQVRRLTTDGLFGCVVPEGDHRILLVFDQAHLIQCLTRLIRQDLHESLGFRFIDEKGQGDREIDSEAAIGTYPVGGFLPSWGIEVFLRGDSLFDEAARRQQAIYIWTGTLVIALILLAAAAASQMIHRQLRLSRLKNDFIATVTHELKTPLASMRVLVDTLIEGRTRDAQQASEYLHLIAKENVRLTGLIDNFLTFSRMERNRHAFVLVAEDPAAIVQDAVEAVKTKFGLADCRFALDVEEGLPPILADHDAMVTVLVNLLDNACKYTGNVKEISLRAKAAGREVCFSVTDNGAGIPRRAQRRIFEKFYQVDQTLSRKAGGCGLGLAIVKFIVDAHHGSIAVDSRVGQGSTFTVRVPAGTRGCPGRA